MRLPFKPTGCVYIYIYMYVKIFSGSLSSLGYLQAVETEEGSQPLSREQFLGASQRAQFFALIKEYTQKYTYICMYMYI